MRKLALSDEILLSVDKPARYIGGEINMVKKRSVKSRYTILYVLSRCIRDRYVTSWHTDFV